MSNNTPDQSPGWYPDRITPGMNRWWDGTQWSSHTQPAAAAPAAPAIPAAATVAETATSTTPITTGSPYDAPAPVPASARPVPRNGIAWASLVLGIVGIGLAISDLRPGSGSLYISTSGVIAIILGARALSRHRFGQVSVLVPEIIGIVLGSVATIIFLVGFAANAAVGG